MNLDLFATNLVLDHDYDLADVEPAEIDTEGQSRGEPWNPDDIRIVTKPYSLRHICDMKIGRAHV